MEALDQPSGQPPVGPGTEQPLPGAGVPPDGDFLTCPAGHRFPREHLTIRNGQFVCPVCDRTPWATTALRRPWSRIQLREPFTILLLAVVMLLAEIVSLMGLAASYSNANVGGSTWLIVGAAISLLGAGTAAAGVATLIRAIRSGAWSRGLLSLPLVVIAIGAAFLAVGDFVSIGFNVAIINSSSPGATWELLGTIFDGLFFGGLAGALIWAARLAQRSDPD